MDCDFSESSYAFAFTHNFLNGLSGLTAAPVFPSLQAEGRANGGYDVRLDLPGVAVFVQFKLVKFIRGKRTREFKKLGWDQGYRVNFHAARNYAQQRALVALEQAPNSGVFYAFPKFIRGEAMDASFRAGSIPNESGFLRPGSIGLLTGSGRCFSFDNATATSGYLFSEPTEVPLLKFSAIIEKLRASLTESNQTLRAAFPAVSESLNFISSTIPIDRTGGAVLAYDAGTAEDRSSEASILREFRSSAIRFANRFGLLPYIVQAAR